jgi:thiol-disulfide isomerase/thioredoxin
MGSSGIWQILISLLVVAVVIEAVLIVGVTRQVGTILLQMAPPRPGDLEGGPDLETQVRLPALADDRAAVVMFLAPDCHPCRQLLPSLPVFARHYPEFELLPIVVGEDAALRESFANELTPNGQADMSHVFAEWNVRGTPFAVGIDDHGIVRSKGVVNNLDQLEALAETVKLKVQGAEASSDSGEAVLAEIATR